VPIDRAQLLADLASSPDELLRHCANELEGGATLYQWPDAIATATGDHLSRIYEKKADRVDHESLTVGIAAAVDAFRLQGEAELTLVIIEGSDWINYNLFISKSDGYVAACIGTPRR
jgi:hypothetical protein